MKRILITGGAGFIGSHLTKHLVSKGYEITILDNLSKQIHGENQQSPLFQSVMNIANFILGDVCNKSDLEEALQNQDAVVHLAAETGTGQSMYDIEKYCKVNILGTANLLDILANQPHGIKKIIVASSRAIYGEGKYSCPTHGIMYPSERDEHKMKNGKFNPICHHCGQELVLEATDENSNIHPASIYGITKQQQEQMVLLMGKNLQIPAVALRYQNVYGPGQSLSNPYTGILSIFSTRLLNGNGLDIYEDGKESRDFVYIDDVVEATTLAIENNSIDCATYNVGSGVPTSVLEVAEHLKKLYQTGGEIKISGKYRLGDIRHNFADLTKINKELNFVPKYQFQQGIVSFVEWVKQQKIQEDKYEESLEMLAKKGLIK